MKEPIHEVSKQILGLVEKNGGISLLELEQALDVSYNLIFLAIDKMVSNNQINLKKTERDYFLSRVNYKNGLHVDDTCVNEYLCQDV